MDFNYAFICALFVMFTISVHAQDDDGSYGRRRRPRPESRSCRWGSDGICGGFVNAKCATGTTCRHVWPTATAGLCCRNKPATRRCKYGRPGGSCGVVGGSRRCLPGYTCQYFPGSLFGTCCKTKQDKCNHGQDGVCGTILGRTCRPGTTCRFMGNFPDAGGKCCINKRPNGKDKCNHGQDGVCGTILGRTCRPGTTCRFMGNFPDAGGKCCINKRPNGKGRCPKSSGMAGICVFDPNVNCLRDGDCRRGQLCCSAGCGRVCKDPVYLPTGILL